MRRLPVLLPLTLILAAGCAVAPKAPPPTAVQGEYRFTSTGKHDDLAEPRLLSATALAAHPRGGDVFNGVKRGDAKTSIAPGGSDQYPTIAALRASLKSDARMRKLGITEATDSPRTPDELRNVTVSGVIFAISKESDNDFHLIVGDQNCHRSACIMNVEVSGLPRDTGSADYAALSSVRAKFVAKFNGHEPGTSGYDMIDPPMPVTVSGSLFFDIDHGAGRVGPTGRQPSSSWEIHPVTEVAFAP
jgi:hypothetical protein